MESGIDRTVVGERGEERALSPSCVVDPALRGGRTARRMAPGAWPTTTLRPRISAVVGYLRDHALAESRSHCAIAQGADPGRAIRARLAAPDVRRADGAVRRHAPDDRASA